MRTVLLFMAGIASVMSLAGASIYGDQKFKTSGSPSAPLTIEIYTDYECPHCRDLYLQTIPKLVAEYVKPGKVRLVHRDFPLPQHLFAKTAAKFANCAGTLGRYELVSDQLFRTQTEWSQNGNIDGAIAKVLPPGEMQKLRALVKDQTIDDGTAADVEMGYKDALQQTPTMEIVFKGKREQIGGPVQWELLKRYIDTKLGK